MLIGKTGRRAPPGPSLHPLQSVIRELRRDPLGLYLRTQREYGDVVRLRLFGPVYLYLVSHPDGVKHVLLSNYRNYPKGFISDVLKPGLGEGLLTSEGELWFRQRRLMQPAFHRERLVALVPMMTDAIEKLIERWKPWACSGQPFNVATEMSRLTLGIVSHALFGLDVSGEASIVGQALDITNAHATYRYYHPFAAPPWVPTRRNRRAVQALRMLDAIVHQIIAKRRGMGEEQGDLLDMLFAARDEETGVGMNDKQIRDEVMTILLAGHDTSANALAWTWYLLAQHPEIEQKLHTEVIDVLGGRMPMYEDLPKLPYTRMVLDESLRLYPPAWATARQAKTDDEIGGYHIPARAPVTISQYITHRHPAFWDDPETFDPERFSPERSAKRPKFAYFPFSGGPRQCIGNNFALLETQLILAAVVQRYHMQLVPDHPIELEAMINLRPRYGVMVTLHER
jgi:cytochrome P450